jgi:Predicted oxidoreductases (related to aryl-alcohol dehydrogenases)
MLEKVRLGRTDLMVSRVAMGCIPIQRLDHPGAVALLRQAYDAGVNFFDTAHVYTDSEAKVGDAFSGGLRQNVIIATKAMAKDYDTTMKQLEQSLRTLKTDYIDIYQWHNPGDFDAGFQDARGPFQAMQDAKKAGKIRHIGMTQHHLDRARTAVRSGMFDTIQYPLSILSTEEELEMTRECVTRDVGVIAMKAMCGGMLQDGRLPFAFLNQYPHIVPIWGMEKKEELDQFVELLKNPEPFTGEMQAQIEVLRAEWGDEFCRGCGYCLPCPANINIPVMMRIVYFVKRNRSGSQFTPERLADSARIDDCVNCRACVDRCPYHLSPPEGLKRQQKEYYRQYELYKQEIQG